MDSRSNYFELSYNTDFPSANYFTEKYGVPPSNINIGGEVVRKGFYEWLISTYPDHKIIFSRQTISGKKIHISKICVDIPSIKAIITFDILRPKDSLDSDAAVIVHFVRDDLVKDILTNLHTYYKKNTSGTGSTISLIIQTGKEFLTRSFPIKIGNMNVGLNYGEEFLPVYKKIIKTLNSKNEKGLVLFHGIPGSGKTSLLKYIAKKVKKEVIFVSPSLAESISSPGFIPFLMNHSNSILIIEDAEKILMNREGTHSNQGVSNILNISDGILGDCLNIQIIATFNTNLKNIDEALLRKGRLIAEHEFKALSKDQSNKLLEHLGEKPTATKDMTLTEIYNIEEEEFKVHTKRTPIGFSQR